MADTDSESEVSSAETHEHSESSPEHPAPEVHSHEQCRSMIQGLSERVGDLETQLRTVISIKPDSTPVKGPWTHRKF